MFKRKAYDQLLEWKNLYAGKYACLLEGARRVGKTTIAEEFAKAEYESYIKIDFSNASEEILSAFNNISNLDFFFLQIQTFSGIELVKRKSVIIFDEIQLFPKARQAIKHLVKDGRYDYIETGSLISIKKNVQDILIPSEEHKISVYPMDYEEFLWATGKSEKALKETYKVGKPLGEQLNRELMRNFRIYMAVGGMPQAVNEYIEKNSFDAVDKVKREILNLYQEDLRKLDPSGRLSSIFTDIPSQLANKKNRFVISSAIGKKETPKDEERFYDLIDSKIVIPCFNVKEPSPALSQTKDYGTFKLYVADIGLFITMIFSDSSLNREDIYKKLLSDKLEANLGYLYENAVAQMINNSGRDLYYHTWYEDGKDKPYEVDFLITTRGKVTTFEVKSSTTRNHKSLDCFIKKHSKILKDCYIISQKDLSHDGVIKNRPVYMTPYILEE